MKLAFYCSELTDLKIFHDIWGYDDGVYGSCHRMVCDILGIVELYRCFGRTCCFHRQCKRLRQCVPPKCRYNSTRLHGVAPRKTTILIFSFLGNCNYTLVVKIFCLHCVLNFMQESEREMLENENNLCCRNILLRNLRFLKW
jgi:hypothetical protein